MLSSTPPYGINRWLLRQGGVDFGPFTREELIGRLAARSDDEVLVSRVGSGLWTPLESDPSFSHLVTTTRQEEASKPWYRKLLGWD